MLIWMPRARWAAIAPLLPASFTAGVELGQPVPCAADGSPYDYPGGDFDDGSTSPAVCWDDSRFTADDYVIMRAVGLAPDATIAALAADPGVQAALATAPDDPAFAAVLEALRAQIVAALPDEIAQATAELEGQ